jgi:hypothetical protein
VIVEHASGDDGTGTLYLRGPLEMTASLDTALTAYAAATKARSGGTAEERKLNGLVEWAERYLTAPGAPRRHGRAHTVTLCLDAPTMFGLASHPAEIPGYGMVPASAALRLLADGGRLRHGTQHPARARRDHRSGQHHPDRPPMAPSQDPRRLDLRQEQRRHRRLDQPLRPH